MPPDREAPEYIEAVVEKKPHHDDPKDIRIREIIENTFLQESWAQEAFASIRQQQIDYLKDVLSKPEDTDYVDQATQEIVKKISDELRSTVEEGQENLDSIPKGSPALIMTNHLGTYKLTGINPQTELDERVDSYDGYDFMYPYPLYFAALSPVAEKMGDKLSYTSDDFPGAYGKVHTAAGFVYVPPATQVSGSRTAALITQTAEVVQKNPHVAIVNFPEGGTSGKYNEAGPYDLLDFKTGGYVVAAQLGMYVVPVAQFFDPLQGMRLKVFEPVKASLGTREEYKAMAAANQQEMQAWLSEKERVAAFSRAKAA